MLSKARIIKETRKIEDYLIYNKGCHFKLLKKEEIDCLKQLRDVDLNFFYESDPACDSLEEIKLTYPGFKAIIYYRIAHILYKKGQRLEARIITELAHSETGIDIHPGAQIGSPFFIDHGTGIVIGETSIVGRFVRIYQGVTLGAISPKLGQKIKGEKRHPTILDNVTIYAGATLLGNITIGNNVIIGGGVFLLEDIPDNTRVTMPKPILNIKTK